MDRESLIFSGEVLRSRCSLRGCDFFDFSQKPSLKTLRLDAKNSRILNKVTASQHDSTRVILRRHLQQEIKSAEEKNEIGRPRAQHRRKLSDPTQRFE